MMILGYIYTLTFTDMTETGWLLLKLISPSPRTGSYVLALVKPRWTHGTGFNQWCPCWLQAWREEPHSSRQTLEPNTDDVCAQSFSHVQLFVTPWTVACQAPLFMVFPRQEYGSGLSFPTAGYSLNPGIKPASFASSCIGRQILYHWVTWEAPHHDGGVQILQEFWNGPVRRTACQSGTSFFLLYRVRETRAIISLRV